MYKENNMACSLQPYQHQSCTDRRRDNDNLIMSGVLSTPNPRVVDEKCALSLHYFDLLS